MMSPICARAQAPQLWYWLTGVCPVRHTSVDHYGLLLGRVIVLRPWRRTPTAKMMLFIGT
jgi:hypothetical protein